MYYTYVLQSDVDNNFYVGYTKDLKLRFARLNPRSGLQSSSI
ncbi:GIY-YIG nuclease family protein [Desulfonatronovibrio magnus]